MVPKVVRNGPGHWCTKKSLVPFVVSNSPNSYPNINTLIHWFINRSICHRRYRQLIRLHPRKNTVDIDGRFDSTYGELLSIVDRRWIIEIICGRFYQQHIWNVVLKWCICMLVVYLGCEMVIRTIIMITIVIILWSFFFPWFWLSRNQSTEWVQIFGHLRILDQYSEDKCKAP